MQAFGSPVSNGNEKSEQWVLHCVLSTCFSCDEVESLPAILPSTIILGPFVEASLALLWNIPTGMERLPPQKMSALSSSCMNIVLGGGFWDKFTSLDECGPSSFNLIPEEDAFDILCRLPQPTFSAALAAVLNDCPVSLDPSSQDHLKLFDMLEPLLWLSNMPVSNPKAHRALVEGGACEFLVKVILDSPREVWSWEDRATWRVKGEAITCLGNIIEKMDQSTLRSHLREDIIKAIADIRDNVEAPLAQRDQATFTLLRYETAAGCYDVEPLCKETLGQELEDPLVKRTNAYGGSKRRPSD
ncbi:hypothetical protein FRC00_003616 [Tulasnella sp. 408]|nr:hypothetical protein FRC00_003616 [Tulasnella sp. 408]